MKIGFFKFGPHQNQVIGFELVRKTQYGFVLFLTVVAQLQHVAEDGDFLLGFYLFQDLERRFHTGGIGVVGIQKDGIGAFLQQLGAVVGGFVPFQSGLYFFWWHFKIDAQGDGRHDVVVIMATYQVGVHLYRLPGIRKKGRLQKWGFAAQHDANGGFVFRAQ